MEFLEKAKLLRRKHLSDGICQESDIHLRIFYTANKLAMKFSEAKLHRCIYLSDRLYQEPNYQLYTFTLQTKSE